MDLGGPTPRIGPIWGPSGGPSQREGNASSLFGRRFGPQNGPFGPFGPFGHMGPKMGYFTPFWSILDSWGQNMTVRRSNGHGQNVSFLMHSDGILMPMMHIGHLGGLGPQIRGRIRGSGGPQFGTGSGTV